MDCLTCGLSHLWTVLPAHEVFQHGALPGALPPHHGYLRQVKAAGLSHAAQRVLQLVHEWDELLHPAVAHRNGAAGQTVQLFESGVTPVLGYTRLKTGSHTVN